MASPGSDTSFTSNFAEVGSQGSDFLHCDLDSMDCDPGHDFSSYMPGYLTSEAVEGFSEPRDSDLVSAYIHALHRLEVAQAHMRQVIAQQQGLDLPSIYSEIDARSPELITEETQFTEPVFGPSFTESGPPIDPTMEDEQGLGAISPTPDCVDKGKGKMVDKGKGRARDRGKPYFRERPPLHMRYGSSFRDSYLPMLTSWPPLTNVDPMAHLLTGLRQGSMESGGFSGDPSGSGVPHHDD